MPTILALGYRESQSAAGSPSMRSTSILLRAARRRRPDCPVAGRVSCVLRPSLRTSPKRQSPERRPPVPATERSDETGLRPNALPFRSRGAAIAPPRTLGMLKRSSEIRPT